MPIPQHQLAMLLQHYKNIQHILVVGGGPSLKNYDLNQIKIIDNLLIICCNQAFLHCPQAQISHHSDYSWWLEYQTHLKHFKGQLMTGCGLGRNIAYPPNSHIYKLHTAHGAQTASLFKDQDYVYGNNCGLQALALAHHFTPQNIWLIGFDFKAQQQQSHGYQIQIPRALELAAKFWPHFLKDFSRFEHLRQSTWASCHPQNPLPQIYNLNADSALKLYPYPKTIPDFLN
jgi:hypothetical protein